jgi:hypothetical protein
MKGTMLQQCSQEWCLWPMSTNGHSTAFHATQHMSEATLTRGVPQKMLTQWSDLWAGHVGDTVLFRSNRQSRVTHPPVYDPENKFAPGEAVGVSVIFCLFHIESIWIVSETSFGLILPLERCECWHAACFNELSWHFFGTPKVNLPWFVSETSWLDCEKFRPKAIETPWAWPLAPIFLESQTRLNEIRCRKRTLKTFLELESGQGLFRRSSD